MNLNVYNSILRGALRPSMINEEAHRNFKEKLRIISGFSTPTTGIASYHDYLKEVVDYKELFEKDGLEVFINQKPCQTSLSIEEPIMQVQLEMPLSTTKRFYSTLLKNETTRITNRIYHAMNMSISDINKNGIINTTLRSIKAVFTDLIDVRINDDSDLALFVYDHLEGNLIRLLLEVEQLFPDFIPNRTDEYQLYGELLKYDAIPSPLPYSLTDYGYSILSTIHGDESKSADDQQPTEPKKPTKKGGVKWLRYINYDTDVEALKDLLSSLKVLECIDSNVGIVEFRKLFSGNPVDSPIVWIGSKGDLKTLIQELINQEKVEEPTYKWKTTSRIFIQPDGSPFDNSIKNIPPTVKEAKIITAVSAL